MSNFESGVAGYVVGKATVEVHFPIDFRGSVEIACKHCPYLSSNERICQLNKMPVEYPYKYVGSACPLIEVEKIENKEAKNE